MLTPIDPLAPAQRMYLSKNSESAKASTAQRQRDRVIKDRKRDYFLNIDQ